MTKKLTIEEVKEYINNNTGCVLLSTEYIDSYSKLKFICEDCKTNTFETTWNSFKRQNKHKCNECGNHKLTAIKRKHTYEYVYNYIHSLGGELLSKEYISAKENIEVKCSQCKESFTTTLVKIKRHKRATCPNCNYKNAQDSTRFNIKDVKDFVKNNSSCILISDKYINSESELEFECGCKDHTRFFTTFYQFKDRNKRQCNKCSGIINWNIDLVRNYVKENSNCELLSKEYINNNEKLKFKCECGNEFEIPWNYYLNMEKKRCNKCNYNESNGEKALLYDDVYTEIAQSGCELLSKEYKNTTELLSIKCGVCKENIFETSLVAFRGRKVKACPKCNKSISAGERKFKKLLEKNNITYIHQHKYDDCKYKNKLKFDFYLNDYNIIIEVDGLGHFKPIPYFGGEEKFKENKIRDGIKNKYCKDNNIPIIRIPYDDRNMNDFIKRSEIVIGHILSGKFEQILRILSNKLKLN